MVQVFDVSYMDSAVECMKIFYCCEVSDVIVKRKLKFLYFLYLYFYMYIIFLYLVTQTQLWSV